MGKTLELQFPFSWECEQTATTTQECFVTATSSYPVNAPTYHDWIVLNSIFLFVAVLLVCGFLFSPFKS